MPAAAACLRPIALSALEVLTSPRTGRTGCPRILRHAESGAKKSSLTSQRPDGPPMADPTPSIRMAPPDGAGNPIPERFLLGLAPKKPAPLAPARATGPSKPITRKGRLRVSIAGREGRPHARGWLCVCLPDSDGRLRGRACFLSPSHPREMAESAASPHRHARSCSGATLGLLPNNTHLHQRFKVKSLAEIDSTVSTWGGTTLLSPKRARGRAVEKAALRTTRAADER